MTRPDTIQCIHEPFGDAFYFGPEKISPAFADNQEKCDASGHARSTYASIVANIEETMAALPERRIFVKDMSYHIVPCYPHLSPATAAPSLTSLRTEAEDTKNPSLLPWSSLKRFQITFLIRHPDRSVPSKYKFTVPPLSQTTKMKAFYQREIGYRELRLMFDFLRGCQQTEGGGEGDNIVVIDAEDLLADPSAIVSAYCERVGIEFDEDMLTWNNEEEFQVASRLLEKYKAYHVDALESRGFIPKAEPDKAEMEDQPKAVDDEWRDRFGEEGAKLLRGVVDESMDDYQYLTRFRLRRHGESWVEDVLE
ncbi:hypothetical protein H2200_010524 [Cladophialophora chaetospira]|uniref:P-loop containing nucleoside triphosphate hydrolase protein n=1 Tax=Cladophialophora chaetospira TaxID=386627 RepID=A0AA39CED1_9EURO|nr:hypothetical protein H2200_010524 [Cladophialophora chaetospira]